MRRRKIGAVAVMALALGACFTSDDNRTPARDAGGSGDADVSCAETTMPVQGARCDCNGSSAVQGAGFCVCTSGTWVCRGGPDSDATEETTPDLPDLVIVGAPEVSEVTGNGDGAVNPGETWQVTVVVGASGTADGTEVETTLSSSATRITVDPSEQSAQTVSGQASVTYAFAIDETAGAGSAALAFGASATGYDPVELPITVTISSQSRLVVEPLQFENASNPTDLTAEAGETWKVKTRVINQGDAASTNVTIAVEATSETLAFTTSERSVAEIGASGAESVEFTFEIAASPTESEPTVTIRASSESSVGGEAYGQLAILLPDTLGLDGAVVLAEAAGGDGDGVPDEGEIWTVTFPVRNSGAFAVTGIAWRVLSDLSTSYTLTEGVCVGDGTPATFTGVSVPEEIAATTTATVSYSFPIAAGMLGPCPDQVSFNLRATSEQRPAANPHRPLSPGQIAFP